jgi:hypothetical protein
MSKSTRNTKIRFARIRQTKSDYVKHFVARKLGASVAVGLSFLLGTVFTLNMAIASAQPSSNPPGGTVNARFNSVNSGTISSTGNITSTGNIALGNASEWGEGAGFGSQYLSARLLFARLGIISTYNVNGQHLVNYGTVYTRDLSVSNEINATGDVISQNNINAVGKIASVQGIGSYFKAVAKKRATHYPSNSTRKEIRINCPLNTVTVSCSGYLYDETGVLDYMGAEKDNNSGECRSYARRTSAASASNAYHYTEAYCFDSTGTQTEDIPEVTLATGTSPANSTVITAPVTSIDTNLYMDELNINLEDLQRTCLDPADCIPSIPSIPEMPSGL